MHAVAMLLAVPLVFVTLIGPTLGSAQPAPQKNQPISRPAQTPASELAAVEGRLRAVLQQEARQAAIEASTPVIEAGRRDQETAKFVLDVMKNWIAVVTFVVTSLFGVLVFVGWKEYGAVKLAKEETSKSADEARKAAKGAEEAGLRVREKETEVSVVTDRVRAIDNSIAQSVKDLAQYFGTLPKLERRGILEDIVGDALELPPREEVARYEEADILITISDKSNSLPKADLVEPLIRLGVYWRTIGNYARALARLTRAVEVAPDSASAHRELCGVLYVLGSQRGLRQAARARLLNEAQTELAKARELGPDDIQLFFDEGWIFDELGEYDKAEKAYKKGQELSPTNRNFTYNLACTYTRSRKFEEALQELSKIIADEWEDAEHDVDFEPLRADPEYGPRFRALVDEARRERA